MKNKILISGLVIGLLLGTLVLDFFVVWWAPAVLFFAMGLLHMKRSHRALIGTLVWGGYAAAIPMVFSVSQGWNLSRSLSQLFHLRWSVILLLVCFLLYGILGLLSAELGHFVFHKYRRPQ